MVTVDRIRRSVSGGGHGGNAPLVLISRNRGRLELGDAFRRALGTETVGEGSSRRLSG